MSNAPTPVIRIETGTSDTVSFSAIAEEAVRTLRFIGFTATKRTSDGIARIDLELPLSAYATDADLAALGATISASIETLSSRISALEAKQWTQSTLKIANYPTVAWEHVLVDLDGASGDVTITLPASSLSTKNARVRVTDVSADGGVSGGVAVKIACTFVTTSGGYYAVSPYVVANDGSGLSRRGATIELLDTGAGWLVVQEGCQP